MSDLTDFLLARISDEEKSATAAGGPMAWPAPWTAEDEGVDGFISYRVLCDNGTGDVAEHLDSEIAAFIVAHDPARVLAECAAKRKLIDFAEDATGLDLQIDGEFGVGTRDTKAEPYLGDLMLRLLAAPFSDHVDYDGSWAI
jgi:hypothetical protein